MLEPQNETQPNNASRQNNDKTIQILPHLRFDEN